MEHHTYKDSRHGRTNLHSPLYDSGIPVFIGKKWRPAQPVFVTARTLLNDMEGSGRSELKESSTTLDTFSERIYENGKLTSSTDSTRNRTIARSYGSTISLAAKEKQPSANTYCTPTKTQFSCPQAPRKMPATSSFPPNTTHGSS